MDGYHQNGLCKELPPLVGLKVAIISLGLERSYDRARGLEEMGYRIVACGDIAGATETVENTSPEAVIIDLGRDVGFPAEVAIQVRQCTNVPLLVVGCAGTHAELLRCFEAGADDYCRPRCPTDEIDLRLRAIFRRAHAGAGQVIADTSGSVLRVGDIEVDSGSQTVRKRGISVPLSPTEFRLLLTLAEHPGEVIPSKALIARVWGNQYAGESHYLRLYIRYLRQKLEDDPSNPRYIVNRWGTGYTLESPARAVA